MLAEKVKQDEVLGQTLIRRFEEAKKHRERYDKNWQNNRDFYRLQDHRGVPKPAAYMSEPSTGAVFEYTEIQRGYLSDRRWSLDTVPSRIPDVIGDAVEVGYQPAKDEALDKARKINNLLDFIWNDTRFSRKLPQILLHTFQIGTGIAKVTFDPDNISDAGIGQIETSVVDPFYIYPDPDATCVEDAAYIIEKHPVSVRWILERYPDRAREFLANASESTMEAAPRGVDGSAEVRPADEGKAVDILECWYHDSAIIEDEETGKVEKKYPNGRYSIITDTGFFLEDKPCEYEVFPYVLFPEIPVPGEFWGGCTVDRAIPLQKQLNVVLRSIIDNGLWMAHGVWVADRNSGVTAKQLSSFGPRSVIIKNSNTEVRRDVGQQVPPHLFQLVEFLTRALDRVLGMPDVLRGIVPSRQPVQTTMIQQDAGEVRTRERERRVEDSLESIGRLWLDMVAKHWTDKRNVRSATPTGGFDMFQLSKEDLDGWQFDIFVRPGSTTPMNTDLALQKALELRREGIIIPDEFIVRLAGIPGAEDAVRDFQAQAMQQQQMGIDPSLMGAGMVDYAQLPEGEMPPEMGMPPIDPLEAGMADNMAPEMVPPDVPDELGMEYALQ